MIEIVSVGDKQKYKEKDPYRKQSGAEKQRKIRRRDLEPWPKAVQAFLATHPKLKDLLMDSSTELGHRNRQLNSLEAYCV